MNFRDRLPTALGVLAKAAFVGAAGFALWNALIPGGDDKSLFFWDKLAHFTAFYVVALLAIPAFPRASLAVIAVALTGLGVLIEVLQALPMIHRDSDVKDVVADVAGIAFALLPVLAWRLRALGARATQETEKNAIVDLPTARKLKSRA
ncbi:VanZ family protein [Caulobacter sp. 17J80-11]|uniref:VanZ family protein n=1 Tax=Caulobacter sp. 17J80-11 TaxID=2763502 RepID=UPI001653BC26|nr:VanZ family protein [Caulobacter sp. 17J80-11]MBC6980489.1 VanZ family protein [Caulobacter sp. 17J80-11]